MNGPFFASCSAKRDAKNIFLTPEGPLLLNSQRPVFGVNGGSSAKRALTEKAAFPGVAPPALRSFVFQVRKCARLFGWSDAAGLSFHQNTVSNLWGKREPAKCPQTD